MQAEPWQAAACVQLQSESMLFEAARGCCAASQQIFVQAQNAIRAERGPEAGGTQPQALLQAQKQLAELCALHQGLPEKIVLSSKAVGEHQSGLQGEGNGSWDIGLAELPGAQPSTIRVNTRALQLNAPGFVEWLLCYTGKIPSENLHIHTGGEKKRGKKEKTVSFHLT